MINYADCLRYYAKYIRWDYLIIRPDLCKYYQSQCRYHKD